ncbi:MAG: AraC family transcriptional regulator of adaptative response [Paracoccaceae bacterium]|jgi:AraC family transcriptional regulator of adaptative response/methylated-DNA-[protein]-cysteine methyltransferase
MTVPAPLHLPDLGAAPLSAPVGSDPARARFHHDLMIEALKLIEEKRAEHPSLEDLAARMGLSPAYFQRMFSAWVGVSPKRYLQSLDLAHAKRLLADRRSLLDAALDTGLSGPGRLHDLFVRWEAMTPGEWAAGADGVTIRYGWFDTPFGEALAMGADRGLCGLAFAAQIGREAAFADMAARWPKAHLREDPAALRAWVEAAFGGGEAKLLLIGAPFQIKVWEALLRVPMAGVTTYSDIARAVGTPKAQRAVGTAVGRNPVSWLIPCHRALRMSGALGGYHWGLPVKRAMLAWETARRDAPAA